MEKKVKLIKQEIKNFWKYASYFYSSRKKVQWVTVKCVCVWYSEGVTFLYLFFSKIKEFWESWWKIYLRGPIGPNISDLKAKNVLQDSVVLLYRWFIFALTHFIPLLVQYIRPIMCLKVTNFQLLSWSTLPRNELLSQLFEGHM